MNTILENEKIIEILHFLRKNNYERLLRIIKELSEKNSSLKDGIKIYEKRSFLHHFNDVADSLNFCGTPNALLGKYASVCSDAMRLANIRCSYAKELDNLIMESSFKGDELEFLNIR